MAFVHDDGRATHADQVADRRFHEIVAGGLVLDQHLHGGEIGVEFPVGGRFVDLLAVDANRSLVVIELKVSRGYDRVVGQLLRYMGWIEKNLAEDGQAVRGIILANEISEDLKLACSRVADIALFEYEIAVKVKSLTF